MRVATLLLSITLSILLVAQRSSADTCVKAEKSQESAASSATESASSEQQVKANTCTGEYEAKSKQESNKAAAQSSQSSRESYEARTSDGGSCSATGGSVDQTKKYKEQEAQAKTCSKGEEIKKRKSCGCGQKKDTIKAAAKAVVAQKRSSVGDSKCKKAKQVVANVHAAVQTKKEQVKSKPCGCGQKRQIKKEAAEKKKATKNNCSCQAKKKQQEAQAKKEEHERNVKKYEDTKRKKEQHEENVKKYEEAQKKKAQHEENVKKCEEAQKKKAQHEENVKIYEEAQKKKEQHNENVKIYEEAQKKKAQHEENVRKWVAANYKQKSGEGLEAYFKRITCKEGISDEEYIKRLSICRSLYSSLDLWYSEKYLSQIKEFYSLYYSKKAEETKESYFKRLLLKESFESEENWANRVNLLRELYPTLEIFNNETYYSKLSKHFFETFYKKAESESTDSYLKKVFTKVSGESDQCFWKRVKLIQKTFPKYKCWYNKENLKKIDVCKSLSQAKSEEELKKKVESEKSSDCSKDKLECLQTFFKSSKSSSQSSSSSSSSEESVVVKNSC